MSRRQKSGIAPRPALSLRSPSSCVYALTDAPCPRQLRMPPLSGEHASDFSRPIRKVSWLQPSPLSKWQRPSDDTRKLASSLVRALLKSQRITARESRTGSVP